jgi:DNA-binding PadR family transcriptional regulator
MDVRTLCLGVLTERAMSGYEIKKHFEHAFRHFFVAGFGSIYPALAELARDGLVSVTSVEQEKRPDKKVYELTERGWAVLLGELGQARPQHRVRSEFLALMYFAHLLPAYRVPQIMDEMVGEWERRLHDDLARCESALTEAGRPALTPGQRFGLGFGQAVISAAIAYVGRQKGSLLRELEAKRSMPAAAE